MARSSSAPPSLAHAEFTEREYPLTPRGVARAARDSESLLFTAPSLLFTLYLLIPVWIQGPWWRTASVTLLVVVFAVLFLGLTGIRAYPLRDRLRWLAAAGLVFGLLALLVGEELLYMVMFGQMLLGILLPRRWAWVTVVALTVAVLAGSALAGLPAPAILAVIGAAFALSIGSTVDREIMRERLEAAEERNAVLAVAAERARIGRDLHDILGHSLTTITVSAQLANRLLDSDPEAAREQIREIERLSRQSLADTRATASGMQHVRAAGEIASARSVLNAAGIEPHVPTALPPLDDDRAELFGYVIREGVTNVVRHSRAATCTIRIGPDAAEVIDDGVGIPPGRSRSGLAGLAARVGAAGGELETGPARTPVSAVSGGPDESPGPGTRLIVRLPGGSAA